MSADPEGEDSRTTSMGLYNLANSYRIAAEALAANPPRGLLFDNPVRFLFFHAIELYLKAYLRRGGVALARLREIGHHLPRLSCEAQKRGLALADPYEAAIQQLAKIESVMLTRYTKTGYRTEMTVDGLRTVVRAVHLEVRSKLRESGLRIR